MTRRHLIGGAALALTLATLLAAPAWLAAAGAAVQETKLEQEPQADDQGGPGGHSPEEWAELAEHWERWGQEFGQRWGEEFAEGFGEKFGEEFAEKMGRWGEEFGQSWGEEHSEEWQRWAEQMAERGEGWEEMGERIGRTVEQALSEVDWDEIGKSVEQSMKALEEIDWEGMSADIERRMEEMERRLEERRQRDTGTGE
jgi:hypothetical protein